MTDTRVLSSRKHAALAFGLIGLACVPLNGIAATFSPTDEAELRADLLTAENNGTSDTIDLNGDEILLNNDIGSLIYNGTGEGTLTIQNGSLRAGSPSSILQIRGSSTSGEAVVISNVTFSDGSNTTDSGTGQGGAIDSRLPLIITSSTFSSNSADLSGGAIYGTASIQITNSFFTNNDSVDAGGAVTGLDDVSIGVSLFSENTGDRGGAVFTAQSSSLSVTGSTFESNSAGLFGGAVFSIGSSPVSISTSTFYINDADDGGGALYFQSLPQAADISRVTLWDNAAGGANGSAIRIFGTAVNLMNTFVGSNFDADSFNCQLLDDRVMSRSSISPIGILSTDNSCVSTNIMVSGETLSEEEVFESFFGSIGVATNSNSDINLTVGSEGDQALLVLIPAQNGPLQNASGNVCLGLDQRGNVVSDGMCDIGSVELLLFERDTDFDGLNDEQDNCPLITNGGQENRDGDQFGDVCDADIDDDREPNESDAFPMDPAESVDTDNDGIGNNGDTDDDGDGQTDVNEEACGSEPVEADSTSPDADNDGIPDCVETDDDGDGQTDVDELACGSDPLNAGSTSPDADNDGIPDCVDDDFLDTDGDGTGDDVDTDDDGDGQSDINEETCGSDPLNADSTSPDADNDGIPNCVDNDFVVDTDGDGIGDDVDNCPVIANENQENLDGDQLGDVCDDDIDGDGVPNAADAFPTDRNETDDTDNDGIGDNADTDDDGDGQTDINEEACSSDPLDAGSTSPDADNDGIPDCVDNDFVVDTDGDGIGDDFDNCPADANPAQEDADGNGIGDACEVQIDPQPVTVYQNVNFGGSFLSAGEGDISIADLRNSSVGNDRISSIDIAPGYEVIACQNSGLRGRCEIFTGSVTDLRGINFNDVISSLRVRLSTSVPVTVYQNVNFGGSSLSADEGDISIADLRNSSVGNDRISSIDIAPGYEVIACQNSGLRGRCVTFTDSVTDLRGISFNDTISSLRVKKQ